MKQPEEYEEGTLVNWSPGVRLPGSHLMFVGPTLSGKTTLFFHILLQKPAFFDPFPDCVEIRMETMQPIYALAKEKLSQRGVRVLFKKGCADMTIESYRALQTREGENRLVVVDDCAAESAASAEISRLVSNGRHVGVTLVLIWQSLFYSNKPESRQIAQNVSLVFALGSLRLKSQLSILGSQLCMRKALLAAFDQVCEKPPYSHPSQVEKEEEEEKPLLGKSRDFRYLAIDLRPFTPNNLRLRTNLHSNPQICFF